MHVCPRRTHYYWATIFLLLNKTLSCCHLERRTPAVQPSLINVIPSGVRSPRSGRRAESRDLYYRQSPASTSVYTPGETQPPTDRPIQIFLHPKLAARCPITMTAPENKKLMQHIFAELAQGNSLPFVESMTDDFSWTVTGTTKWSRKYDGKRAVLDDLFGALLARVKPPIIVEALRFIADEDYVAVEARGRNTTKKGLPYNNRYCFVFRLADGKLKELTEYLDTELVTLALGD